MSQLAHSLAAVAGEVDKALRCLRAVRHQRDGEEAAVLLMDATDALHHAERGLSLMREAERRREETSR